MGADNQRGGLFPALLKHWRRQRGWSQLDLALVADVSSRHISFLETGRSTASAPMVMRLATALDVPLRHVNGLLRAAGHEAAYPEAEPGDQLPDEIQATLDLLGQHHDPFPLLVIDRKYDVLQYNRGAAVLLRAAAPNLVDPETQTVNLLRLTFDPEGARRTIVNFEELARDLLWRLQREVLAQPDDNPVRELLDEILAMPTVAEDWRHADLTVPSSPTIRLHLKTGPFDLKFLTLITAFQTPQTVALDELRIETWLPCDAATAEACKALVGER